jgi:hypothetical protein
VNLADPTVHDGSLWNCDDNKLVLSNEVGKLLRLNIRRNR